MSSCVVLTLLLCTLFGAVFCDSPEVQVVKRLITTSNKLARERNQTEIALPDVGWIFEPVRYRQGSLGKFDTLVLLPHPKIVRHSTHNGTLYSFNVNTTLKDLNVHYQYFVNYPFFGKHGNVTITVNKKTFQLEGRVLVKQDRTCFAVLENARLAQLGDFKVNFIPNDAPYITKIYESVLNFVHEQIMPLVNHSIQNKISRPNFRKHFSKYVCDEVKRH